jgi:hypothetical protein
MESVTQLTELPRIDDPLQDPMIIATASKRRWPTVTCLPRALLLRFYLR